MKSFRLGYAIRSLVRGGQRTVLAILCIAFGVMALVSMQLLSAIVADTMMMPPELELGGDIEIAGNAPLGTDELARLETLKQQGVVRDYTLIAKNREMTMLRREGSGRVQFLTRAMGVDASTYPLVGKVALTEPHGATLRDVLRVPGDVIVTRDVARKLGLEIGSPVKLGGRSGSAATPLRVAGIAELVPDRMGDSMLYDTATARLIARDDNFVTSASALLDSPSAATRVEQAGFTVRRTSDVKPGSAEQLFNAMLKGAGILGLLIGGIGVANTLTVLFVRRTLEIATLKAIGYRRRDLFALFTLETALLGIAGSLIGALVGVFVSAQLMSLLDSTEGAIMLVYRIDTARLIGGVAAGIVASTAFGLYAITRAVAVRPAVLLRGGSQTATAGTRASGFGIVLLVSVVFGAISAVVMGSIGRGALVVAVAIVALAVLGPLFAALLSGILRLPLPGHMLHIARRNLQHQRARAIVAMIALFIGAFTIGFAAATMLGARERVIARHGSDAGLNLNIYGRLNSEPAVRDLLTSNGIRQFEAAYTLRARVAKANGSALALTSVEGRSGNSAFSDIEVTSGTAPQLETEALLPAFAAALPLNISIGDTLAISSETTNERVIVAGFYRPTEAAGGFASNAIILTESLARKLAGDNLAFSFNAAVPVASLDQLTETIGLAAPGAMVVSKADFNALRARSYQSLFIFVAGLAGLALLAGAVLIANAVGLALVERKREIGIFKALGYTAGRVLTTILLENALLGILAGTMGILSVRIVMGFINRSLPQAELSIAPVTALTLLLLSTTLALGSAAVVAWRPTRLRPLVILRED